MPEDLYSGSFQAEQFKSFTELLRTRCVVHDMRSTRDFRREVDDQLAYYHAPNHETRPMEQVIQELLPNPTQINLNVYSRQLVVPAQSDDGVALFSFDQICEKDLGPADYISISSRYHTVIIDKIPILTLQKKNEARRLISLIDALYESKCKLVVRAESTPDHLFFPDQTSAPERSDSIASEAFSETYYDVTAPNRPNVSSYASASPRDTRDARVEISESLKRQDFAKLNAFTGQDEQFAFRRAASRLFEMTSAGWWHRTQHLPNLDSTGRKWEVTRSDKAASMHEKQSQIVFKHGASPFRTHSEPPPKFGFEKFWGMVTRDGIRKKTDPKDWQRK